MCITDAELEHEILFASPAEYAHRVLAPEGPSTGRRVRNTLAATQPTDFRIPTSMGAH
jgi:hypothetical protein